MHGKGEWQRNLRSFFSKNQRLLWFLGLFLFGAAVGCAVFKSDVTSFKSTLSVLLTPTAPAAGLAGVSRLMVSACFPSFVLLAILFLAGLSACGAPLSPLVPLFYGAGIGLAESYFFAQGGMGVGYAALFLLPHTLFVLSGLSIACAESLRMSLQLCRQLLPRGGSCGSLWQDLKLYFARFLLCSAILFAAGALQTLLRIFFLKHFV